MSQLSQILKEKPDFSGNIFPLALQTFFVDIYINPIGLEMSRHRDNGSRKIHLYVNAFLEKHFAGIKSIDFRPPFLRKRSSTNNEFKIVPCVQHVKKSKYNC